MARFINEYQLVKNKINFSYQILYMQSTKEAADYALWIAPKFSFRVLPSFSININYNYRLENVHLNGLSNYNDILMFGLTYKISG